AVVITQAHDHDGAQHQHGDGARSGEQGTAWKRLAMHGWLPLVSGSPSVISEVHAVVSEPAAWIDGIPAAGVDFEMQVRSGRIAGAADPTDGVTGPVIGADDRGGPGQVAVPGNRSVGMAYL